MKEFHVVEYIGKPEEVISRMGEAFGDIDEIRVTIRYNISEECKSIVDSVIGKKMASIQKVIKVNRRLSKNDDAIAGVLNKRFKISLEDALRLVKNCPAE